MTPCEVLHDDGRWYLGTVERWRQDPDGWRALVRYVAPMADSPFGRPRHDGGADLVGQYVHWRTASEVRPVTPPG